MQKLLLSVQSVAGLLACLLPDRRVAAADDAAKAAVAAHAQCRIDHGPRSCIGYVVDPGLQILGKPDSAASPVGNHKFRALEWIAVVEPSPRPEAPEWVRVRTLARPGQPVLGWARHDQLVLATDFRRVVGCWPQVSLELLAHEAGHSEAGRAALLGLDSCAAGCSAPPPRSGS